MIETPTECGNPALTEISKLTGRSVSKSWLRAIHRDGKAFCAWCNRTELAKYRSKYCSLECSETSSAFCNPQTNAQSFYFLLRKQNKKCTHCAFDYSQTFEALKRDLSSRLRKKIERNIKALEGKTLEEALRSRPYIKRLISEFKIKLHQPLRFGPETPQKIRDHHRKLKDGREPEVDHILPIAGGGSPFGFDNLQLLCYTCHKAKTSKDLALIRSFKRLNTFITTVQNFDTGDLF